MNELNWAVLGCGAIANTMAASMNNAGRSFYAVGSRTYEKAAAFAEKYKIGKVYTDVQDMFSDPEVDVVYIATPHNTHYLYMKAAVLAGKHVFVEKAITLNLIELDEILSLAAEKNVLVGEAMTIYHMPLYKKLRGILDSGELGAVNVITMNFGSFKEYDMTNRFFSRELAGGAMLDIGVYALSFMRFFMSSCPDRLSSYMIPAPTNVDEQSVIIAANKENQMATVALSLHSKQPKRGVVACEKGYIEIMEYPRAAEAKIIYSDGRTEMISDGCTEEALYYEILDMEAAAAGDPSLLCIELTKDVQRIMTELRFEWKTFYPEEEHLL